MRVKIIREAKSFWKHIEIFVKEVELIVEKKRSHFSQIWWEFESESEWRLKRDQRGGEKEKREKKGEHEHLQKKEEMLGEITYLLRSRVGHRRTSMKSWGGVTKELSGEEKDVRRFGEVVVAWRKVNENGMTTLSLQPSAKGAAAVHRTGNEPKYQTTLGQHQGWAA